MKFEQQSVSKKYTSLQKKGKRYSSIVEINTLEELLDYVKKEEHPVIISDYVFNYQEDPDVEWSLETYDGYME